MGKGLSRIVGYLVIIFVFLCLCSCNPDDLVTDDTNDASTNHQNGTSQSNDNNGNSQSNDNNCSSGNHIYTIQRDGKLSCVCGESVTEPYIAFLNGDVVESFSLIGNQSEVIYENLSERKEVAILTKDHQSIVINAPFDEIFHYGSAEDLTIEAVAGNSYNGYATVSDSITIKQGNVILNSGVGKVIIEAKNPVSLNNSVTIGQLDVSGCSDVSIGGTGTVQTAYISCPICTEGSISNLIIQSSNSSVLAKNGSVIKTISVEEGIDFNENSKLVISVEDGAEVETVLGIMPNYIDSNVHIHFWDEGVTTNPTCSIDGKILFTCVFCSATKEEKIPALGHDWVYNICSRCGAKEMINGILSGDDLHWTKERSPYLINGNVLVPAESTLIIDPGVEVLIEGAYFIKVEGQICAIGNEEEKIVFRGVNDGFGTWGGINCDSTNMDVTGKDSFNPVYCSGNRISNAIIKDGNSCLTGRCWIDNSELIGVNALGKTEGIYDFYTGFSGVAIECTIKGKVEILEGTVKQCIIVSDAIFISSTTNGVRGISSGVLFSNEIVANNNSYSSTINLYSYGSGISIVNNAISGYKSIQPLHNQSNSFYTSFFYSYNTFNNCGIDYSVGSYNVFNDCDFSCLGYSGTEGFTYSNFSGCNFNSVGKTGTRNMQCNYWGDEETFELNANGSIENYNVSFINDYFDDFSSAKIDYSYWSNEPYDNIGYQGKVFDYPNYYTVTLNPSNGDQVFSRKIFKGQQIDLPTPSSSNYIFVGWYYNDVEYPDSFVPDENITLIAKWEAKIESVFSVSANGELSTILSDYNYMPETMIIPSEIEGKTVKTIPERLFYNMGEYCPKEITLPDTLESISGSSFWGCPNLSSITISDENAFFSTEDGVLYSKDKTRLICYPSEKTDLKFIIPNSVQTIDSNAFYACKYLSEVVLPEGLLEINYQAFGWCKKLEIINIPASVTLLGDHFISGSAVKELTIPETITSIPEYALWGCGVQTLNLPNSFNQTTNVYFMDSDLQTITIGTSNLLYMAVDGILFSKDGTKLVFYPQGKTNSEYSIPEEVTEIGDYAFFCNYRLNSVLLHAHITSIGNYAFQQVNNITSIEIPTSVTQIGNCAFYAWNNKQTINVDADSKPEGWSMIWNSQCNAQIVFGYMNENPR